jgi:hypothetical protein
MTRKPTKRKINRDVQITKIKVSIKQLQKDVARIKDVLTNPQEAMLLSMGTITAEDAPVFLKCGIGAGYAKSLKDAGETDKLKELGVSEKEIEQL